MLPGKNSNASTAVISVASCDTGCPVGSAQQTRIVAREYAAEGGDRKISCAVSAHLESSLIVCEW